MGANYYKIISSLILLKDELNAVDEKKFHNLITVLQGYEIFIDYEDVKIPDKKEIAAKLNLPYAKVLSLIKSLYESILLYFSDHALEITECEQEIQIYVPYDEEEKSVLKMDPHYYSKYTQFIKVKLPVIPRIGEEISLDFIESSFGMNRGYVHNIRHVFMGKRQVIEIFVHPFDNYYFKWKKMEINYEEHQLWKRRMKSEAWK
jgi:hypothetical protein